jgi:predicted negative regulator of RcsB-dependent stress response
MGYLHGTSSLSYTHLTFANTCARAPRERDAHRLTSRNHMAKKARPDVQERVETLVEWLELHSRQLMFGSIGLLVIAGGFWFFRHSNQKQAESASVALGEAESAVASGNLPLAQSSLEKLVQRYGSTPSGVQAHVLLAQVHYEKGEFQQGMKELDAVTSGKDAYTAASALNLQAAGLEQSGKLPEAAAAYQKAAARAPYKIDHDVYMANAARVLTTAGKTDEAKKIWTELASDDQSPAAAEARVRLGELEAKTGRTS